MHRHTDRGTTHSRAASDSRAARGWRCLTRALRCGLACLGPLVALPAVGQETPAAPPPMLWPPDCEPSVTEEEAGLLREADALADAGRPAAIARLKSALTPESSPALRFAIGAYQARDGLNAEAIETFAAVVDGMPRFHRARRNLAALLLREGRAREALTHLRVLSRAEGLDPEAMWRLVLQAQLDVGNPVGIEQAARQILLWAPDAESVRLALLQSLLDQNRLDEAQPMLRAAVEANPSDGKFWSLLVNVALRQERPEEAMVLLECVRRLGAGSREQLAALGDLYLDQGVPRLGLMAYSRAAALPDAPAERIAAGIDALVHMGRLDEAEVLLEMLESRGEAPQPPLDVVLGRLKAEMLARRDRHADAVEQYRRVLAIDPLDGAALLGLARLHRGMEQFAYAEDVLGRARRVPDLRFDALVESAQLRVDQGRYAEAVDLLTEAYNLRPSPHLGRYLKQVADTAQRAEDGN